MHFTLIGSSFVILIMLVLIIFAISTYLNKTLGWFSSNKQVNGTGMQISVKGVDAEAECTVYLFGAKENAVLYTKNDGSVDDPKIDNLDMQIHDAIFKSRNRYTPAVIHIHLTNIQEDLQNGGTVSVTITRDNSAAYSTDTHGNMLLPDKTTSVLRFTLANNFGTSWLGSNVDPNVAAKATYFNIDNALYAKIVTDKDYTDTESIDIDSNVFTDITKSGSIITNITKSSSITLSVGYTSSEVSSGELDLFLYLTYDEDLVKDFEGSSGIDTGDTSIGHVTDLLNDLTSLVISFSPTSN